MTKRSNFIKLWTLVCLLTFSVSLFADWDAPAKEKSKKNPVPADTASLKLGKELYEKKCASCHGDTGKGDGKMAGMLKEKPSDISDLSGQTDGELFWKITVGKEPMPSFSKALSEKDRWSIVNYLRTWKK